MTAPLETLCTSGLFQGILPEALTHLPDLNPVRGLDGETLPPVTILMRLVADEALYRAKSQGRKRIAG